MSYPAIKDEIIILRTKFFKTLLIFLGLISIYLYLLGASWYQVIPFICIDVAVATFLIYSFLNSTKAYKIVDGYLIIVKNFKTFSFPIKDISCIQITDQKKLELHKNGLSGGHILGYSGSIYSRRHGYIDIYSNSIENDFLVIWFSVHVDPIIICPTAKNSFLTMIKREIEKTCK